MDRAQTEGWAPQLHFLSVEIDGDEMRIWPIGNPSRASSAER